MEFQFLDKATVTDLYNLLLFDSILVCLFVMIKTSIKIYKRGLFQ